MGFPFRFYKVSICDVESAKNLMEIFGVFGTFCFVQKRSLGFKEKK